ncbi:MAG: helix-turn-helix domain-containing protein [Verrucomicrobia bacterium]|nr:helix-turn-helix domain-containing protein [Verrucomicrobiota bacterium]
MGRRRTQLTLSAAEQSTALRLLENTHDPRVAERLCFALEASTGRHTLEELARRRHRTRATMQNWLGRLEAGGLEGLLARAGGRGRATPMAKATIQRQLRTGLRAGRWTSAAQVAAWLRDRHGIRRSRKSLYYWFQKQGLSAPGRS